MKPELKRFCDYSEYPPVDFHIHTTWTDGRSAVEEYVRRAVSLGLKEIAFTEHVRRTSEWYQDYVSEVRSVRQRYNDRITIYHGIETKVMSLEGRLDATDEMLANSELVLGSVHRYPSEGGGYLTYESLTSQEAARIELDLGKAILENPAVDVLGHPGGVFMKHYHKEFPRSSLRTLISIAGENSKAVEINSKYGILTKETIPIFQNQNPIISWGSDAHDVSELGNISTYFINLKTII